MCQSVLVAAAAMASLCFGMDVLHSQRQEPVCPSQHSCSSRSISNASFHLECSCDARCREHGDCCRDSQYYSVDEQRRNVHEYVCVADTLAENHVYVKVKCAQDWNNTEVQALCMRGNTIQDTIHDVPVTSWIGDSYANAYCAVCNGEDPGDFRSWNVYMVCDAVPVLPLTSNDDYDIMFNEGRWGVIPRGLRDASAFTPCRTHFVVPQNFRRDTRRCLPTVKTCSDARADQHDLSLCESYTAAVYHEDFIFRNQHCASCNGYKQSSCVQPAAAAALPPARPALTMLLSLENNHIDAVDTSCSVWEVKDRSEECRLITCPQLNEEFRYSKCVSVQGKATLSTSELLCPFHHSCSLPEFIGGRGCSCDATCRQYGDCCRDSQYYDAAEQTKNVNEYECVDGPLYDGVNVYMRAKCLEKWNNTEVQALCLMGNTQTGDSKLFPVTSTTTATTYVNHYCALCNGEDTASLRMWHLLMECQNEGPSNEDYNVGFHEGQWGIITPSLGLSSFQPCFFSLQIPNDLWNYTKPCLPIVKTCSDSGVDQRDQILCQSYTAFVYYENFTFRNQHCAFCSGYKEYSCMLELLFEVPVPPIATLLFDFSDACGRVGHECRCNSEELWDKWFEKCMKAFCSKPNEKFHINKCVPH